jgi:hypothetical protein
MDAGDLQVKALADKAKQITQQKKQLQARQSLEKRKKRCVMPQSLFERPVSGRFLSF